MDINIEVVDANNITLVVTPTPTQTITIDRGIAGPQGPAGPAGGGATSVSVVSANGLAGTVANPTTTPAITLSTTVTGIAKGDGTALSAAVAGTDYIVPPSGTALLKANSGGALANAVANTDYITPPSGTSLLKAGSGGALANAVSGTDYAPATSGSSILYGNSAGGFNNVTVGSGLSFAAGTLAATGGSSGDVIGPASATDKAIVTFDGTTGKLIQNNSGNTIGTTGNTVISVTDNTNAALRITQLGTGNAFLVEDSTNPDATPFVIDATGVVISGNTTAFQQGTTKPYIQIQGTDNSSSGFGIARFSNDSDRTRIVLAKSRGGLGSQGIVQSGDVISNINSFGSDGTNWVQATGISSEVDGTPGTNDMPGRLTFSTTADGASGTTERMRIDSAGNVGIGGTPPAGWSFLLGKTITGAASSYGFVQSSSVLSDVTNAFIFSSNTSTQAAAFILTGLHHYRAAQSTIGAGSSITNQFGFIVDANLTGATNNYGFSSNIPAGTNRWNLWMAGTANNYMAGSLGIGTTSLTGIGLNIGANATGSAAYQGIRVGQIIQSDVTSVNYGFHTALSTAAASFTLPNLSHFQADQGTIGATSAVTAQNGFYVANNLVGATNNYGFYGGIAAQITGITTTGTISTISSSGTTVTVSHNAITYTNGQTVTISATANATALVSGATATILTVGTTDYTLIGAASNTVGVSFTATGAGTGDGTVRLNVQGSGKTVAGAASGSFTYTTTTSQTFTAVTVLTGTVTVSTRFNLYMVGTAANYLGGQLQLGQDYIEKTNVANTSTAITLDLANGTFQVLTLTGSPTITMPTAVAGKSFVVLLKTGTGSFTVTWSTVKWPGGTAPTITSTASKQDIFSFFSDGTNWYGTTVGQNYTP